MEINETKTETCIIIGINGRLDTTNYGILEKKLKDLIDEREHRILVDCARMDYVSSSGLRILLMTLKSLSQVNGKFILCNLQENIKEIFEISGFNSIFEIYPTKDEALKVF
jgi:anti-sigma B factor antagonist